MKKESLIIGDGRARTALSGERGVALLLTLLVTIILAVVVLEFGYLMRVHATLSGNLINDLRARSAAEAGIQTAKAMLLNDIVADAEKGSPADTLDEEWAEEIELTNSSSETLARITDETAKLNLNRLVKRPDTELDIESTNTRMVESARRLFESLELDPNLVDLIIDWIDENDEEEPFGAEGSYYESLDFPVQCKNGPLDSIEELLLMDGFDEKILHGDEETPGLVEFVTICGDERGRVNINTAPEEVLSAVLKSDSSASIIMDMREEAPFERADDMTTRLPGLKLSEKFTTHGSFFLVSSTGRALSGDPETGGSTVREVTIETLLKRVRGEGDLQDSYFGIDTVSRKVDG